MPTLTSRVKASIAAGVLAVGGVAATVGDDILRVSDEAARIRPVVFSDEAIRAARQVYNSPLACKLALGAVYGRFLEAYPNLSNRDEIEAQLEPLIAEGLGLDSSWQANLIAGAIAGKLAYSPAERAGRAAIDSFCAMY